MTGSEMNLPNETLFDQIRLTPTQILDLVPGDVRILITANLKDESQTLMTDMFVGFGRIPKQPGPEVLVRAVLNRMLERMDEEDMEKLYEAQEDNDEEGSD